MLSPSQIRDRLRDSAAAALDGDETVLDQTASWLASLTARELVRVDHYARQDCYEGTSRMWAQAVVASPFPVVAVLASMHRDGYVRELAVGSLATSLDVVSDRALAVRVTDHVGVIREKAMREVLRRLTLDHAEHVMPVLLRIEQRSRAAIALALYLDALVSEYGEAQVWGRLRRSADRDLQRVAFQRSIDSGLLELTDAIELLPREKDQVVRRQLIRVIADSASADVIAKVLLGGRSAESRALGLVKLTAAELDVADVQRLLIDRSVLVRLWARRRWQEMGHDAASAYAAVARSAAMPIVRARAYIGLAETETAIEREEILGLVQSTELPLRKVGLSLLRGRATAQDVPLLLGLVADDQSRVARLASEVLVGGPRLWSVADLAPLKAAHDPERRRRAWWLHRHRGGWDAVIADLELLHDSDPELAALGRHRELPMYFQPTGTQRQRIMDLLATVPLDQHQRRRIGWVAGIPDPS